MKIYTKTGDKGTTSLYDGVRVSKDSVRVESYGTVDELVSHLGLAKNFVNNDQLYQEITEIQNKLFTVGSNLATEDPEKIKYKIVEEDIISLEAIIDKYMKLIGPPEGFIIPGAGKGSGFLHVARTVCRRCERRIISLQALTYVDPLLLKYVNRLSDVIYSMARFVEEKELKVDYNK